MKNKSLTTRLFLLAIVVSAVLSACNGSTTASEPMPTEAGLVTAGAGANTAEPDTNAAPAPTNPPPTIDPALLQPPEPIDACLLVSEAEAAEFLGSDITAVENEPGDHTGTCKYITQTPTDRPHLKISWTPNYGAGDYELIRSVIQNPSEEGNEIGDTFYIRSELTGVQLRTVRGEQYLILEAYGVTEPDAALKALALQILAANP